MKNWFKIPVFLLLSLSGYLLCAEESGPEVETHFQFFKQQYPRFDGSGHEAEVFSYIEEAFIRNNLFYSVRDFDNFTDGHSFSQNIAVTIDGSSDDTMLLVVPVNHRMNGSKDGVSWNLAVVLGYLLRCKERVDSGEALPVNLTVLFAGGEYGPGDSRQMGSELFLDTYFPERNAAVLYFELEDLSEGVMLRNGGNTSFSPYWIIDRLADSLADVHIPLSLDIEATQLYRLGISNDESRIDEYLRQELPALEICSVGEEKGALSTAAARQQWFETLARGLDIFMARENGNFPGDWDRHYLYIHLKEKGFLITETVYIRVLLGVFTVILLFLFFFRRRMGKYRRILFRKFWAILVLFAIIFIFLFIGTYFIQGISVLRNFKGIWQYRPLLFFFLKLSAAISLFFFLFRFVKEFPFPVIRSFYSATAIFLFFTLTAVVSIVNISLGYYFVWAFIWSVLFSIFQNRFAKLSCLFISAGSLFYALYELFVLQSAEALRFLIISPIYGNLFLSLVLLPFILMIIRISIGFTDAAEKELHIHAWAVYSIPLAALAALTVYGSIFSPFSDENLRRVRIEEVINYDIQERKLTVYSEAPLGNVMIDGGGYDSIDDAASERVELFSDSVPDLIDVQSEMEEFLDRRYYTLTASAEGSPVSASVVVRSEEPLIIYDANFPFQIQPGENRGELFVGSFPPNPLQIELVVPMDLEGEVQIQFHYTDPPYPLSFSAEHTEFIHRLRCITWTEL